MVAKTYILENLRALNKRYNRAATPKDALFVSKLAILELCGWIEESMDDVILRCSVRHLKLQTNRNYCLNTVVGKTYGFDYDWHFRGMLIRLIGLIAVEKVERQIDPAVLAQMKASLTTLKAQRNAEAHTHLKGVTKTLNAPSVTITHFQPIYDGLTEFDRIIRDGKW